MGSRRARTLSRLIATLAICAGSATAYADWPRCLSRGEDDRCPIYYLNAVTDHGNVELSVGRQCRTSWRHDWGRRDAHRTIVQWLDRAADTASGGACIPLDHRVTEIRATPLGGRCGYEFGEASQPGPAAILRRGGADRALLSGCHATLSDSQFGGIALRFADTYGLGDSYLKQYFYGVYDGFGQETVAPFGATTFVLSEHDTYHYLIEIFAGRGVPWRSDSRWEKNR